MKKLILTLAVFLGACTLTEGTSTNTNNVLENSSSCSMSKSSSSSLGSSSSIVPLSSSSSQEANSSSQLVLSSSVSSSSQLSLSSSSITKTELWTFVATNEKMTLSLFDGNLTIDYASGQRKFYTLDYYELKGDTLIYTPKEANYINPNFKFIRLNDSTLKLNSEQFKTIFE